MSETVSPKPSATDGPGPGSGPDDPSKEMPVNSQQENGTQPQIQTYPTPNSHPPPPAGQPQPATPASQQPEQLPTPQQQNSQPPREPSTIQPASGPPSLPPIQGVEQPTQLQPTQQPQQPQQQPAQQPPVPTGQQMPINPPPMPQMASMSQFYAAPQQIGVTPQDQMNMGTMQTAGYQERNKLLSGGRHKKEVKRRTKTGCLTCRKRRIKCDEAHPVCRNCVKSKRECMGYDPVFRTQPAPSAIQPAPNPPPSLVVSPQNPASYPPAPAGYVAAGAPPFASLPSESPTPSLEPLEYSTSVEHSLPASNSPPVPPTQATTEGNLQPQAASAPPLPVNPADMPQPQGQKTLFFNPSELVCLDGVSPPPKFPIRALSEGEHAQAGAVFFTYAAGADRLLETHWFQGAAPRLLEDSQRQAQFAGLVDLFQDPNIGDPNVLARANSLEASVVWEFLEMCRIHEDRIPPLPEGSAGPRELPPLENRMLALNRFRVVEALVTGDYLDNNPCPLPHSVIFDESTGFEAQLQRREYDFWSALSHMLTLRDGEPGAAKEIDEALGICRGLLDTYENRDVLYSIAIARVIGQRWHELPPDGTYLSNGEHKNEALPKLYLAQKFLEGEAGGKATVQVIKRLCGMAVRSWALSREE